MPRRISSLPTLLACPSSGLPTEREYDPVSEAADGGTAGHEALAYLATDEEPDIAAIAAKYDGVSADDVDFMYSFGSRAWRELEQYFPSPRAEEPLEGDGIIGRTDMFHNDGLTMATLDWKTNREEADCMDQVRGYATAAVDQYGMPESGYVTCIVVWVRLGRWDIVNLNQQDIDNFKARLRYAEKRVGKSYAPGDSCMYCRRQLECEARQDFMRTAATSIATTAGGAMTRESLALLHPQSKMLRRALTAYGDALRVALQEGPLPDGEGKVLSLVESKRDTIDPLQAWPVLEGAGFDTEDLAGCIKMSKTAVLAVVGDRAGRGGKGRAKMALAEALRGSGAITQTVTMTVRAKKENNDD